MTNWGTILYFHYSHKQKISYQKINFLQLESKLPTKIIVSTLLMLVELALYKVCVLVLCDELFPQLETFSFSPPNIKPLPMFDIAKMMGVLI